MITYDEDKPIKLWKDFVKKSYEDGETVVYYNKGHKWHLMNFKAYKSQYTENAYRLRYGDREVIADISEIKTIAELNDLMKAEPGVPLFIDDGPGFSKL